MIKLILKAITQFTIMLLLLYVALFNGLQGYEWSIVCAILSPISLCMFVLGVLNCVKIIDKMFDEKFKDQERGKNGYY